MVKCIFCGKEEQPFKGIHLMRNDGVVAFYCSGKCRENSLKLKRDKRKVMWTEAYRITLDKKIKKAAEEAEKAAKK